MSERIPLSEWAKAHGVSRDHALNLARLGKIPGARPEKVLVTRWLVPRDAVPDRTDRRSRGAKPKRVKRRGAA